jgi:hypothetical protein
VRVLKKFSPEEVKEIAARHEAGESLGSLAREWGGERKSLSRRMKSLGYHVRRHGEFSLLEEEQIRAMAESGASIRDVSERLGRQYSSVRNYCKRRGISIKSRRFSPQEIESIMADGRAGLSQEDLARKYNCSRSGITRLTKRLGVRLTDGRRKRSGRYTGSQLVPGKLVGDIRRGAAARGVFVSPEITPDYLESLFVSQEGRCALTGVQISLPESWNGAKTASLDRIDSSKGYLPGNVQWVHKVVNRMKVDLPESEFYEWCARVAAGPLGQEKSFKTTAVNAAMTKNVPQENSCSGSEVEGGHGDAAGGEISFSI